MYWMSACPVQVGQTSGRFYYPISVPAEMLHGTKYCNHTPRYFTCVLVNRMCHVSRNNNNKKLQLVNLVVPLADEREVCR